MTDAEQAAVPNDSSILLRPVGMWTSWIFVNQRAEVAPQRVFRWRARHDAQRREERRDKDAVHPVGDKSCSPKSRAGTGAAYLLRQFLDLSFTLRGSRTYVAARNGRANEKAKTGAMRSNIAVRSDLAKRREERQSRERSIVLGPTLQRKQALREATKALMRRDETSRGKGGAQGP